MNSHTAQLGIAEVSQLLTTDFDTDHLFTVVVDRVRTNFAASWCALVLSTTSPPRLHVAAEAVAADFAPVSILAVSGPAQVSVENGAVGMIDNFQRPAPRWRSYAALASASGLGGCRSFPLRLGFRPVGALVVFTPNHWDNASRSNSFAQSMADLASVGLSMGRFAERAATAAANTRYWVESRITVEQASGVIAELEGVSVEQATKKLSEGAQRSGMGVDLYAAQVIARLTGGKT